MQTLANYRPSNIEFEVVAASEIPENLGSFENETEMRNFLKRSGAVLENKQIAVNRYMDNFEKHEFRKEYNELLETKRPFIVKELQAAEELYKKAKDNVANIKKQLEGTQEEVFSIANSVRLGTIEINLDQAFTFRLAYNGFYLYYTFIDFSLKLCKVSEIPERERGELFNSESANQDFFRNFKKEITFDEIYKEEKAALIPKGSILSDLLDSKDE